MQASARSSAQAFHMSIVEPVTEIVISLFGIYLSISILLDHPNTKYFLLGILILGASVFGVVSGIRMPRKLEHETGTIVISYFGWKNTIKTSDIKSYSFDRERLGRRSRYFLVIETNNGKLIKLRDIKGGPLPLLKALEQWTGLQSKVELSDQQEDHKMEDEPKSAAAHPPEPLSELTERLVQKLFPPEDQYEVRQMLIHQCGNNVYSGHTHMDKYELEPLRFSALKVSKGDLNKLKRAIQTANEDFRNIYAESGFLGKKAQEKQKKWVESILGESS